MEFLNVLIALAVGSFFIWRLYKYVKEAPEAFSAANISKSFYTIGILGVILAVAIYFVVILLRG